MSITPIEEEPDDRESGRSADRTRPGVRRFIVALLLVVANRARTVVGRWLGLIGNSSGRAGAGSRNSGDIRVSGQRRLVSGRDGSEDEADTAPVALPERPNLRTERTDGAMRVYDPDEGDAYIVSDTWRDVEE